MKGSSVRLTGVLIAVSMLLAGCAATPAPDPAVTQPLHILAGTILLSNDDGWNAPGIEALREVLTTDGYNVVVVAPLTNESGASAAVTTADTLSVTNPTANPNIYAVGGTPVDSVMVGATAILPSPPSLVISGINLGFNVGDDLNYSGTVGAAIAGTLYGIPSIAVSASTPAVGTDPTDEYRSVANFVVKTLIKLNNVGTDVWPTGTVLNINYPYGKTGASPSGVKFTQVAAQRAFKAEFQKSADNSYTRSYVADGTPPADTDIATANAGYISVSAFPADRGDVGESYGALSSFINKLKP